MSPLWELVRALMQTNKRPSPPSNKVTSNLPPHLIGDALGAWTFNLDLQKWGEFGFIAFSKKRFSVFAMSSVANEALTFIPAASIFFPEAIRKQVLDFVII
ncbi:hypothetical protein M8C21_023578 [Ambrosia artemisiifolia]|uniref:Uncharacterized protein n=1 Tax=Ambrosia artemisiifolia TaxID=4212 RepID=A0AAD5D6Q7_AMBAR|nr:hypothetical protein M8C21_023578 [Ambrosia artemisiifolia]